MPFKTRALQNKYQREWSQNRRKKWLSENGPCVKCGSEEKLEVDHIDPKTKIHHAVWNWSEIRRIAELLKCQVLCKKCHLEKSIKECIERTKGVALPHKRTVSSADMSKVKELVSRGISERKACAIVGISRGTYSSLKTRGYRKEVFGQ